MMINKINNSNNKNSTSSINDDNDNDDNNDDDIITTIPNNYRKPTGSLHQYTY